MQLLTFIAGQSTTLIRVRILDDLVAEESETFMANLTDPSSGLVLGDRSVILITIIDNDGTRVQLLPAVWCELRDLFNHVVAVVDIADTNFEVTEGNSRSIPLVLNLPSDRTVTVLASTFENSAIGKFGNICC